MITSESLVSIISLVLTSISFGIVLANINAKK